MGSGDETKYTVWLFIYWPRLRKCPLLVCVDNWLKLDDDKVSMVKEEDILKLSGGGKSVEGPSTLGYDDDDVVV